ncbi:MAG TPA: ABC transporter permease [Firmicutes bacterium]|nr:ABC transporter permease [Candidatus Fermentithermobacillaceae bacterium]
MKSWSGYLFSETWKSIWRNKASSLLSAFTTGFALFLLGMSFLVSVNLRFIFSTVEQQMEIQAYLKKDISESETSKILEIVKNTGGVREVNYVSKEKALEELKAMFRDKASVLDTLGDENPLPASIRVRTEKVEDIPRVVGELKKIPGVVDVIYQEEVSRRLASVGRAIQIVSFGGVVIVGFVAVMVIGNSIRLTIYSRRHEISIMKLVGATDGFILGPFLLEGIVLGVLGSLIGSGFAAGLYVWIVQRVGSVLPFIPMLRLDFDVLCDMLGIVLVTGVMVGMAGSVFSLRRHLRI